MTRSLPSSARPGGALRSWFDHAHLAPSVFTTLARSGLMPGLWQALVGLVTVGLRRTPVGTGRLVVLFGGSVGPVNLLVVSLVGG